MSELIRGNYVLRAVSDGSQITKLGRLEAEFLDMLWRNRGIVIRNEWVYARLWPEEDRLDLIKSNRLGMLHSALIKKLPHRLIRTKYGFGRYIPNGSGITTKEIKGAREFYLFVKAARGFPEEPPTW